MKTVAWAAILALVVSIPFLLGSRKPARVSFKSKTAPDENHLYDIEDLID